MSNIFIKPQLFTIIFAALAVASPVFAASKSNAKNPQQHRGFALHAKKPTEFYLPPAVIRRLASNLWDSPQDVLSCPTGYLKGPGAPDKYSRQGKTAVPGTNLRYISDKNPVGIVALPKRSRLKKNNYKHGTVVIFKTKSGKTVVGVDSDCGSDVDKGKAPRKRGRTLEEKNAMTIDLNSPKYFWKDLPDFVVAKVFKWKYPVAFERFHPKVREAIIAQAVQLVSLPIPQPTVRLASRH